MLRIDKSDCADRHTRAPLRMHAPEALAAVHQVQTEEGAR